MDIHFPPQKIPVMINRRAKAHQGLRMFCHLIHPEGINLYGIVVQVLVVGEEDLAGVKRIPDVQPVAMKILGSRSHQPDKHRIAEIKHIMRLRTLETRLGFRILRFGIFLLILTRMEEENQANA